jgi:hypothetical protein
MSDEMKFEVGVKKAGKLADEVVSRVTKKADNPGEAMVVLKLAVAIYEVFLAVQNFTIPTKQIDDFVANFVKDYLNFAKSH